MSSFAIKVSLEETAKLAWEAFGEAWSFDDGGIDKHWLYTVQQWPMPASGKPGKFAKHFLNELWSHMEKTYGVIKQPPRPTSARQANSAGQRSQDRNCIATPYFAQVLSLVFLWASFPASVEGCLRWPAGVVRRHQIKVVAPTSPYAA